MRILCIGHEHTTKRAHLAAQNGMRSDYVVQAASFVRELVRVEQGTRDRSASMGAACEGQWWTEMRHSHDRPCIACAARPVPRAPMDLLLLTAK